MANGRELRKRGDSGRDPGGFIALPWAVLDSHAYTRLSHPARSLLLEFARQYVRDNNGRLLASFAYLLPRGWKSKGLIQRARDELLAAGFIHETVKGQRPNRASWYAVTWRMLDRLPGYDPGAAESFERGAYRKNTILAPSIGARKRRIAPMGGAKNAPPTPSMGAIRPQKRPLSAPSMGHHLDKPSITAVSGIANAGNIVNDNATVDQKVAAAAKKVRTPKKSKSTAAGGPVSKRRKRASSWTPGKLAELRAYREKHGLNAAAAQFGITRQRICWLLPGFGVPRGRHAKRVPSI
ncbi:MAG: hypothetical protein LBU72_04500 [Burkholderiaceae bacterium]|nr:hypothetical protein [Burkholderiaceae bacterium]